MDIMENAAISPEDKIVEDNWRDFNGVPVGNYFQTFSTLAYNCFHYKSPSMTVKEWFRIWMKLVNKKIAWNNTSEGWMAYDIQSHSRARLFTRELSWDDLQSQHFINDSNIYCRYKQTTSKRCLLSVLYADIVQLILDYVEDDDDRYSSGIENWAGRLPYYDPKFKNIRGVPFSFHLPNQG